jgi:hypothetical protein
MFLYKCKAWIQQPMVFITSGLLHLQSSYECTHVHHQRIIGIENLYFHVQYAVSRHVSVLLNLYSLIIEPCLSYNIQ